MNDQDKTREQLITELTDIRKRCFELEKVALATNQAKDGLPSSEKKYRDLYDKMRDGVACISMEGKITEFNPAFQGMLGYTRQEIFELDYEDVTPAKWHVLEADVIERQVLNRGYSDPYEKECVRRDGTPVPVELTTYVANEDLGKPSGMWAIVKDITERKKAEEVLQSERQKFQTLAEYAPFGMVLIAEDGTFKYVNRKFEELFGYKLQEVPNGREWFRKAYPDSAYRHEAISAWLEDSKNFPVGEARPRVFSVTCKDGSQKIIHHRPVKLDTGAELMTFEDITDLKRSEEKIRASLKEKDAMLREIRHRVKNNLAVVSGMLRLQSRYASDETHRRMFQECENRVTAMVLAHELVYQSENLSDIRVKEYMRTLLDYLFGAMKNERSSVDLKKEIEDLVLGLDTVMPLGLIVSELVSNSLAHAFPERRKGNISVSLGSKGKLDLELVVKDNGVGMPEDIGLRGDKSIGLELVRILATQLGGTTKIVTDKGTQVSIRFKVGESNP